MKAYCNNNMIANQISIADNFVKRFFGLMGKRQLGVNEGLLLKKCSSIHCFFMKIPIDVVYLSEDMTILWIETVYPWKLGSLIKGAKNTLELAKGAAESLRLGDRLIFKEN